jgi:hypothetical protein
LSTESRINEANKAMAEIANDPTETDHARRERLKDIWIPVVQALVDNMLSEPQERARFVAQVSNPDFVGVTCDSRRPVFLDKAISDCGLVYRKFVIVACAPE